MLNGTQTVLHHQPLAHTAGQGEAGATAFVCISAALRRLLLQAEIAAPRLQLATIEGEPGTGKHLFAKNMHQHCPTLATLPFRRADARSWLAADADTAEFSGTLYLDRVDLLAAEGQGMLLNLIKSLPVDGASSTRFVLLASVQTSLRLLASQGQFLPDLAFRLTAVRFPLTPLREHREDIAPITQALVDRICRRYRQPTAVLAPGTLPRLLQHPWPGNVRELVSVIESAILNSTSGILRPSDLLLDPPPQPPPLPVPEAASGPGIVPDLPPPEDNLALEAVIHRHIQLVLNLNRGNKLRAARQLGISRSTLYRLLAGEATLP